MHICDEVWFFNNVILRTTSLPVFTLRTDTVVTMTLVQMHAPNLEAVNPITLSRPAARFLVLLLLLHLFAQPLFFSPQLRSSVRGVDAPPHKEAGDQQKRRSAPLIFHRGLGGKLTRSHLLSSPPALTMKRSPFVKRTLVR